MPLEILIRLETPGDRKAVREINEQAFGSPIEARLVDALRGSVGSISLVATNGDRIVGHILFTPVSIEPPANVRIAGLAPMAVRPDSQRTRIGSRLVRTGVEECRRHGYSAVVVLGHPDYYPRFGFVPAHALELECEFRCAPEAFMALELKTGALTGHRGLIRYRPEFNDA